MEVWYCDNCGSTKVEEKVWIEINSGKLMDDSLWYKYSAETGNEYFYCNGCEEECRIVTDKPKGEDNGKETNDKTD